PRLSHARALVHADDAARARRQQFGDRAVAAAEIGHVAEIDRQGERARQRLPGPARAVVTIERAGHAIDPALPRALALGEQRGAAAEIARQLRVAGERAL